jgi:hypothetical protein
MNIKIYVVTSQKVLILIQPGEEVGCEVREGIEVAQVKEEM